MKTPTLKTGVWALTLVLVIITGAKSQARAQEKKEINRTIVIRNGDTLVNGKNLKHLSRAERKKLQKELDATKRIRVESFNEAPGDIRVVVRKQKAGQPEEVVVKNLRAPRTLMWRDGEMLPGPHAALPPGIKLDIDTLMYKLDGDSAFKQLHIRMKDLDSTLQQRFGRLEGDESAFVVHPSDVPGAPLMPLAPAMRMRREGVWMNPKNTQSFSYTQVDKDGITNHLNIRIAEVPAEMLAKIIGSSEAKTELEVQDLSLFPSFSMGKLNLSFGLKSKGLVEMKLLDTDAKTVFSDKLNTTSEVFNHSLNLPKNGIYYLAVVQNGKWFIKKLVKE